MLDAIQRLRLERRIALCLATVYLLIAALLQWFAADSATGFDAGNSAPVEDNAR